MNYLDDYLARVELIQGTELFSPGMRHSAAEQLDCLRFRAAAAYFTSEPAERFDAGHYDAYLKNKKLTDFEFENAHEIERRGILRLLGSEKLKPDHPAIYCSFHMGSYVSTISSLVTRDMDLTLVLGSDAYKEKAAMFEKAAQDWKTSSGHSSRFVTIDGQAKNAAISMLRNFKKGNNLFFFIDGNKGADAFDSSSEALVEVDVCGGRILSRRGIAYLAHRLGAPIVPIISYRTAPANVVVEIFDEIWPSGPESEFCPEGTRQIWTAFSGAFSKYPLQWESMVFSHQFRTARKAMSVAAFDPDRQYAFNSAEYGFFFDKGPSLFSYQNVEAIRLSRAYGELLLKISSKGITLPGGVLREIIKDGASLCKLVESRLLIAI